MTIDPTSGNRPYCCVDISSCGPCLLALKVDTVCHEQIIEACSPCIDRVSLSFNGCSQAGNVLGSALSILGIETNSGNEHEE